MRLHWLRNRALMTPSTAHAAVQNLDRHSDAIGLYRCAVLTFVAFKWGDRYTAEHVNTLARMLDRHHRAPHRFVVVTNDRDGLDWRIGVVPDRQDFADWPSPHGRGAVSCYRRMRLFQRDAGETFGERIVAIDLDTVITGDITTLFERDESFVCWQDPLSPRQLCGALWMLKAGAHPEVWENLNQRGVTAAYSAGFRGSDQAWMSYCLSDAARWTDQDGVYSYRAHCAYRLPNDARIVNFHGRPKPWDVRHVDWVRENYR